MFIISFEDKQFEATTLLIEINNVRFFVYIFIEYTLIYIN